MHYILFLGSKLGYETLKVLDKLNININHVFIEKEHEHELEKFFRMSEDICIQQNIKYSINATISDIENEFNKNIDSVDYIMTFGYRRMIPDRVIEQARIAAIGSHFSPLPEYRGFAPLNWLLINGEKKTAVNLFYLDKEVDSGDIIASKKIPIAYRDDINSLFNNCILVFKDLLKETIPLLESNKFEAFQQDETNASYTCARSPEDGKINWKLKSYEIYNLVRAITHPYPGAYTSYKGEKLTILSSEEFNEGNYIGRVPGRVIKIIKNKGVVVLTGEGAILLKDIKYGTEEKVFSADKVIKSVRDTLS